MKILFIAMFLLFFTKLFSIPIQLVNDGKQYQIYDSSFFVENLENDFRKGIVEHPHLQFHRISDYLFRPLRCFPDHQLPNQVIGYRN